MEGAAEVETEGMLAEGARRTHSNPVDKSSPTQYGVCSPETTTGTLELNTYTYRLGEKDSHCWDFTDS